MSNFGPSTGALMWNVRELIDCNVHNLDIDGAFPEKSEWSQTGPVPVPQCQVGPTGTRGGLGPHLTSPQI